ncbi:MAG: hypothetical protein IH606_20570 [Burkholderiales bacterium]|nr:hypothetical protein [Burkholderiales bacterium]
MPARQRGIALLGLLALISVMVIFAYVSGLNRSASGMASAREQQTAIALSQAKEALISYAVTYMDTHTNQVPGYLPCPDAGSVLGEGVTAGICGSALVSQLGQLPWRTLGLDALKDGSGECLWYAVSGTYKYNPNGLTVTNSTTTSNMMNWDTNGQFRVMDANGTTVLAGSSADNRAVAVIFAPGAPLSGQGRTPDPNAPACGGNYTAADYLETANGFNNSTLVTASSPPSVNDVSTFIAGASSASFNDKLVFITRAEIWSAIKKRTDFNNHLRALTRRAAECTAMYGNQNNSGSDYRLPWSEDVSLSTSSVPTYAVNAQYNDVSGTLAGRLSFKVNTSRNDTNNKISSSISDYGTSSAYLFTPASPAPGSYCAYASEEKAWYDNWKDQLFYAVAGSYKPSASWQWWYPLSCPTCLSINASGDYAAVVIFAGEKLSSQTRNTASNKGSIANYLEGRNASNYPNSGGNGNYQAAAASGTFNDIVYAIDSNLAVSCSDSSGVMRSPVTAPAAPPAPANLANYAACP